MQLKQLHLDSITIDPALDFASVSCSWEELTVSKRLDLATIAALPLRGLSSFHIRGLKCVCTTHPQPILCSNHRIHIIAQDLSLIDL